MKANKFQPWFLAYLSLVNCRLDQGSLFPNMHLESLVLLVYFLDKAIRKFGKIFNFRELFE